MSTVFTLVILLSFILLIIMMLGVFLPATWQVEHAELVKADSAELFLVINFLEKWVDWTVWNDEDDESLELTYQGPNGGLGAVQIWKSRYINGQLTITQSDLDQSIQYQLEMDKGSFILDGFITLSPSEGGFTQVAWRCQLRQIMGVNPIARYQAYFLKNYFDAAIKESLKNLKSLYAEESE